MKPNTKTREYVYTYGAVHSVASGNIAFHHNFSPERYCRIMSIRSNVPWANVIEVIELLFANCCGLYPKPRRDLHDFNVHGSIVAPVIGPVNEVRFRYRVLRPMEEPLRVTFVALEGTGSTEDDDYDAIKHPFGFTINPPGIFEKEWKPS